MPKSHFLLPFALFVLALLAIGRIPISTKGEAREALVVKDMLEQKNFILPLRNMEEIPSKPPLYHWIAAAASAGTPSEFSVRLPSVIFAFLTLITFALVLKHINVDPFFPLLICVSSFEWMRSSSAARVDMVFSGSLIVTLICFYSLLTAADRKPSFRFLLSLLLTLSFTGAILSKGPAGGAIPIIIAGLFFLPELFLAPKHSIVRGLTLVPPLLIGGALASWWYYEAYKIGGQEFLNVLLFKENVSRFTGDGKFDVGHEKPFFWGWIKLVVAFLPWSLALPLVFRDAYRNKGYQALSFQRFSIIAITVFIVICTVASSKREVYFLPAFPFLAVLTATVLKDREAICKKLAFAILGGFALASLIVLPYVQTKNGVKEFSESINVYINKGEKVFQVASNFYPTLFYTIKNMQSIPTIEEVPAGALAVVREDEQKPDLADLILVSPGNADDGKAKLALIRRK